MSSLIIFAFPLIFLLISKPNIFTGRSLRAMTDLEGSLSEFSTFVYRGSSHRSKSAPWHKVYMVWLNRLPIPVGRRGVIYSFKWFLPAFAALRGRWEEGGSAPCCRSSPLPSVPFSAQYFSIIKNGPTWYCFYYTLPPILWDLLKTQSPSLLYM